MARGKGSATILWCLAVLLAATIASEELNHVILVEAATAAPAQQPNKETKDECSNRAQQQQTSSDWLFAQPRNQRQLNATASTIDAKLLDILARIGPDMKPASAFRDYDDITIGASKRAWQLMHERVSLVANAKISTIWPSIEQSLIESNVSERCRHAARNVADGARALDAGSIQLLNSWGTFPPAGLFEGSLGDIGSYHGCVNIKSNKHLQHAHYCTIAFRPVVPNRRDFDLILNQEPKELLETFDEGNMLSILIGKAQYYHYVYFKLGTCFPIGCSPFDVQKIAHLIARRWYLMSGPVKCHSKHADDYQDLTAADEDHNSNTHRAVVLSSRDLNRGVYIWKPHITQTQSIALIILFVLMLLATCLTVADLIINRMPFIFEQYSNKRQHTKNTSSGKQQEGKRQDVCKPLEQTPKNRDVSNGLLEQAGIDAMMIDANNNSSQFELGNLKNGTSTSVDCAGVIETESFHDNASERETQTFRSSEHIVVQLIRDCSIITNTRDFFTISDDQLKNDILCMNGLRCITMSWIIIAHTIQYNDWSAFARIYEVEKHLKSLANQPLFNASYLVDTFFLISGLLTSYSVFRSKKKKNLCISEQSGGRSANRSSEESILDDFKLILGEFSCRSYLIGRYLRLTPQILLISLLFILLPLLSSTGGPHWYTMTGEYSENCSRNWWVNLLHIQAFYKPDEMCNFVCWWISVDMLYHIIALAAILLILNFGPQIVVRLCVILASINVVIQASKHYQLSLPPNLFSTIPQTGAMWSDMTLKFFWTPIAHAFPFLFGFYTGYQLAITKSNKQNVKRWLTVPRALMGWLLSIGSIVMILYGTYFWVTGEAQYSQWQATSFYLITQSIWSLSLTWIIIACEFGYGGFIANLLSCKLFLVLGKASYLVYLSHFIILFTFFGSQNLLVEPTQLMITYIVIGNICLSMAFGSLLCIVFEMPWLKLQRRIMRRIR